MRLLHPRNDHGRQAAAGTQPNPSEREIRLGLEGNLCRCTGYHNIVKAIQAAAKVMAPGAEAKAPASVS